MIDNGFKITVEHIKEDNNFLADKLSRIIK